ncbi:hypothetical protein EDB81DRAFT_867642 [Dactylonectria macrodidyma]|uniref:NACHT domain-containing protein n=1 Tax=Dactylonectria macrodidyma TaxID=307937 RepID=A0A9P9FAX0_9HYPO|nr:hypothetical protein EDB81DRAFT_867642 [Dactylonectria macrodidyma]
MGDPLSITASIVAVLQLTGTVVTYLNDVKEASKDRNQILLEISNTRGLLLSLKDLAERPSFDHTWDTALSKLAIPNGPLGQFKSALDQLARKMAPVTRTRTVGRALCWPFQKREVEETLQTIERLKSLIMLGLQRDYTRLSESIHEDLRDVARGVNDLQSRAAADQRMKLIAWLSPLNFWPKQADVFSKRLERTGEWLLECGEFKTWLNGTGQTLWCHGIPGVGKTILASMVIDLLQHTFKPEEAGVAFIYCDYKSGRQHTSINFISSLVQQLVQRQSEVSQSVKDFYAKAMSRHTRPTLVDYSNLLHLEIGRLPKTFIVVDALDEYVEKDGSRSILLQQFRLLRHKVNLLVTSRHASVAEGDFEVDATLRIRANDEDIERYLRFQIHHNRNLATCVQKFPELEDDMVTSISTSAHGMFLIARLHIDSLLAKRNRRALLFALKNLPTEISSTYDEAMQRIENQDEGDRELAVQVLAWISHAVRPLTVRELQHALAVQPGDLDMDEDDLVYAETLVAVCAGLVSVDQQSGTVRFVHYTTEQYFERRRRELFSTWRLGRRVKYTNSPAVQRCKLLRTSSSSRL